MVSQWQEGDKQLDLLTRISGSIYIIGLNFLGLDFAKSIG